MMRGVLALSVAAVVNAATGNVTALCQRLVGSTTCAGHFPAGPVMTQALCETLFTGAVPTLGEDNVTGVNTIGCRQAYANMANANATYWCKFAGFTGGGLCGTVLDNACSAIMQTCTGVTGFPYNAPADCTTNLTTALGSIFGSHYGPSGALENSLECRVYHSLVGYNNGVPTPATDPHCQHVIATPAAGWCTSGVPPDAGHHCAILNKASACQAPADVQYNDIPQCMASFAAFPGGNVTAAGTGNDQGCRQYHSQAAAGGGAAHCHHAGPSGGTVCGTARQAWRSLTGVANCAGYPFLSQSIGAAFTLWSAVDFAVIVPAATDPQVLAYNVGQSADNDLCRLYHLTVASVVNTHCDHGTVLATGQCGGPTSPPIIACRLIQTACNTTAYPDPATCIASIGALFAANKTGVPQITPQTTDTVACRLYQAGLALVQRNMNSTAATQAAILAACNGAKSTSTVCGTSTPMASNAPAFAASALALLLPFAM